MKKRAKEKKKIDLTLFVSLVLILVVLVMVLIGVLLTGENINNRSSKIYHKQKEINQLTAKIISEASKSAKTATKSAAVNIPQNYGKSVAVPILTYHYIGNNPNPADKARDALEVSPDKFEAQMDYLSKNGYNTISLDTMYAALKGNASLPPKPVILTFDDGYIDFYTTAFPILRGHNFHAVSFIPTGLMNQGYYMSWAQIKEIDVTGLVSFQAHSVNHPTLTGLSPDKLKYQLYQSRKDLESQLGKPVNFMAYPYGVSDSLVWNAAKENGYLGAVGTYYGITLSEGNIYNMPRIKVSGAWSIEEFAKRI